MKKGDVGMAKHLSKKYGNKGWAFDYPVSATWSISVLSGCLSMPDATSLHHCLQSHHQSYSWKNLILATYFWGSDVGM